MTSVYGVTFIGAREQIASRLRERGFPWQDWAELCKLSTYAAQVHRFHLAKPLRSLAPWLRQVLHTCNASCTPRALALKPSLIGMAHSGAPARCQHAGA